MNKVYPDSGQCFNRKMHYDPANNCLMDMETGNVVVQFQDNDELPSEYLQLRKDYLYAIHLSEHNALSESTPTADTDSTLDADRQLALQLAEQEQGQIVIQQRPDPPVSTLGRVTAILDSSLNGLPLGGGPMLGGPVRPTTIENYEVTSLEAAYLGMHTNQRIVPEENPAVPSRASTRFGPLGATFSRLSTRLSVQSSDRQLPDNNRLSQRFNRESSPDDPAAVSRVSTRISNDESFARALQMMEFEIIDEMEEIRRMNGEGTDFQTKEISAAGRKRQIFTISTLICLAQTILLIICCQKEGIAPSAQNPLYGPSAAALVKYGAKNAFLIVRDLQWWRLFSAIFMHAGVAHIVCNLVVQIQVGGYLNLVYGSFYWFVIYILCGIFGNMLSCICLPNTVGVGSSGAVLGMLSSWIVWIIFRWKKVPEAFLRQRNCQLVVLVVSIVATLAFSFTPLVDWAAHFGGFIMGILTGLFLLARELDNANTMMAVRIISLACIIALYAWAIDYINNKLDPRDPFVAP